MKLVNARVQISLSNFLSNLHDRVVYIFTAFKKERVDFLYCLRLLFCDEAWGELPKISSKEKRLSHPPWVLTISWCFDIWPQVTKWIFHWQSNVTKISSGSRQQEAEMKFLSCQYLCWVSSTASLLVFSLKTSVYWNRGLRLQTWAVQMENASATTISNLWQF